MPFNHESLKNLVQNRGKSPAEIRACDRQMSPSPIADTLATNQQAAAQILDRGAPAAAALLDRVIRGEIRAPAHVRVAAAGKVLDANGFGANSVTVGQQAVVEMGPEQLARFVANLALAAELKRRKAVAVDVEPLPGGGAA